MVILTRKGRLLMYKFFKGMSFFNQILRMIVYIRDIRETHPAGTALSATSWRQTGIHSRMYSSNLSWPRWIGYLTYTEILYQFMIWFKNLSRPAINSFLIANAGRAVCCFVAVEVGACAGSVTPHGGPEPQARRLSICEKLSDFTIIKAFWSNFLAIAHILEFSVFSADMLA